MKRYTWCLVTIVLLTALALGKGEVILRAGKAPWEEGLFQNQQTQADSLLVNGNMEELAFYWKPPNHFIAGGWMRWWLGHVIPEYDDIRAWRPHRYDGDHAQIYFWYWYVPYTAGIYQRVAVQPCTFYQFSMYGRNHSAPGADHHARIGIDPLGRQYTTMDDPRVESLPDDIVWSPEQTFFYTWGLHTVIAESRSDHITAITYVSPDHSHQPYDTFWDAGTLTKVPPPSERLADPPGWTPDGFITNVVSYTSYISPGQLFIEWETGEPASTQVVYGVSTYTLPITPTATFTHVVYLPLVVRGQLPELYTPVDQSGLTHHQAVIQRLEGSQTVEFVILARRLVEDACLTSRSAFFKVTVHFPED